MSKTECQNIACAGYNFGSDGNCIRFKDVNGCPKLVLFPENFIDEAVEPKFKLPGTFSEWTPKTSEKTYLLEIIKNLIAIIKSQQELLMRSKN